MISLTQIQPEAFLLRSKLEELKLASEHQNGSDWLLKALHPAEPSIAGVSLPDGTSVDTATVEYTITRTIGAGDFPAAPTSNWNARLHLVPHPTCPLTYDVFEPAVPGNNGHASVRVPAFTGVNFDDDIFTLLKVAKSWRLCAQSLTVHLDANATTDTGTVVAAQLPLKPDLIMTNCYCGVGALGLFRTPSIWFDGNGIPSYGDLMTMPRSYQSNVRTGLYMPLKLTNTSQHWHSARELVGLCAKPNFSGPPRFYWQLPNAQSPSWPFEDLSSTYSNIINSTVDGGLTSSFLGDHYGLIHVNNVDKSSNVVLKLKLCLELQVNANSLFTAYLKPPSPVDSLALGSYFRIARELPDAYPAAYNDNGKILGIIADVIDTVAPALSVIPGYGPFIGMAGKGLSTMARIGSKSLAGQQKKRKPRKVPAQVVPAKVQAPSVKAPQGGKGRKARNRNRAK